LPFFPPIACLQMKEEEEKKLGEVKVVDGVKRVVDKLLARRKLKRGYEYEVQWKGEAETSWLTRDRLEEMGFQKLLTDIDMKVRQRWPGLACLWMSGWVAEGALNGCWGAQQCCQGCWAICASSACLPTLCAAPRPRCLPAAGGRRRWPAGQAADRQERGGPAAQPGPARRICHPLPGAYARALLLAGGAGRGGVGQFGVRPQHCQLPCATCHMLDHLSAVFYSPRPATCPAPPACLQIRGLSGGQKVKLVLGAAMWQQPHILVLDEPTNYLDRESLGAMVSALNVSLFTDWQKKLIECSNKETRQQENSGVEMARES
jgi:hypothetical protein